MILGPLEIYFLVNMIYTLFLFFFLHHKVIYMTAKRGNHEIQNVINSMDIYYIINVFFGSIAFIIDLLHSLVDPKKSLWFGKIEIKKDDKDK